MRCPRLTELSPPPAGKSGWPWTVEAPPVPERMPDGTPWPKISIVTPSFNQGLFIEETIRSVLLQGYPDLEYFIIDGGSSDDTLDIIRKYESWITYWESAPDRGQSHAINKGFKRATGDILAWINSDDLYLSRSFETVVSNFNRDPTVMFLYGDLITIDEKGGVLDRISSQSALDFGELFGRLRCPQPACFWKKSVLDGIGFLNEDMHYVFDLEFFIRVALSYHIMHISVPLAKLRTHPKTKTSTKAIDFDLESLEMYTAFFRSSNLPVKILRKEREIMSFYLQRVGLHYRKRGNFKKARKLFLRALLKDITRYQNILFLADIVDTFINLDLTRRILAIRDFVRGRYPFMGHE